MPIFCRNLFFDYFCRGMLGIVMTTTAMCLCAFWSVVLALDLLKYGNRAAHRELLVWCVTSTVLYVGHFVFFNRYTSYLPFFDSVYSICNLAVYPLYLYYLLVLTKGRACLSFKLYCFGVPLLVGMVMVLLYCNMSHSDILSFIDIYLYQNSYEGLAGKALMLAVVHSVAKVLFAVSVFLTLIWGTVIIKRYDETIASFYSDVEDRSLRTLKTILVLLFFTSLVSLVVNFLGKYYFARSSLLLLVPFTFFAILLFCICRVGSELKYSYVDMQKDMSADAESQGSNSEMSGADRAVNDDRLRSDLRHLMREEKIFLKPDLRITDLTSQLGTNRRYLSELFNRDLGLSFSDYVNQRRIEYAKKLMEDNPDMSLYEVMTRSGYLSKSSFYRNMKRFGSST